MYGWHGKVLVVDLTGGTFQEEGISPEVMRTWLGGRGLGSYWLYNHLKAGTDPLGAENQLVFAVGPLTGTKAPASGRVSVSSKSPLTGTIFDSNAGGSLGARLKSCGYDAMVVTGCSASPVYLAVSPGAVSLEPAGDLWGQDTRQAYQHLAAGSGPGCSVACIGPAGENRVRFASVAVDGRRSLGRGGLGAVMGAKGLKGIVVRGHVPTQVADPEGARFVSYEMEKTLKANPVTSQALPEFGTAVLVNLLNRAGAWPAYNFRQSSFSDAEAISGEALADRLLEKRYSCYRCPIGCGRLTRTAHDRGEGPEYETIWALGANLGISDLEAIAEANYSCNRLGLDTISTGGTLACAAELGGLGAEFGHPESLWPLIEKIAYRRGIGNELAEGSRRLAEKYGHPELAMQVKGLELPAYDPRGLKGQGLAYATSNRGGCHLRANMLGPEILGTPKRVNRLATAGKAGLVIVLQHTSAVLDSLVMCKFTSFALSDEHYARLLSRVTGEEYRPQDLQIIGERIWTLERLFNLREGFVAADTLPPRLTSTPVATGPCRDQVVELQPMLAEYYRFREWDEQGRPTPAKLARLGLAQDGGTNRAL